MAEFDPYRKWLGIPPHEQPPNYYRLLGLSRFETDPDVIANAADRQMAHLRTFQSGKNSAISQKILNELAAARICLLDPKKRAEYDAQLRAEMEGQTRTETPPETAPSPHAEPPPIVAYSPLLENSQELPPLESPPILKFPARGTKSPVLPYHHSHRRRKNHWRVQMVTLIVSAVGLLIAGWFIYIAVEKRLFEPIVKKEPVKKQAAIGENPREKTPQGNAPPRVKSPTSKNTRSNSIKPSINIAQENEKLGKRLCFMKGDSGAGLPKLAASASDGLKSLAQKELAAPEGTAERLAVADGWWTVSEKYAPPASGQIRRHAVEWYQKVFADLEGEDRDRAERRISQETPAPPGEKPPVNPEELE